MKQVAEGETELEGEEDEGPTLTSAERVIETL